MNGYEGLVKSKHGARLIFRQPKWLVGTPQILYPNKHHPFALPTIDSRTSVVVGCDQLLLMKVTRLLRHYSATFPARDLARGVMGCLCQRIYLCKLGAPWLWHVLKRHQWSALLWKRGVSYWMTRPQIYCYKRMRCQNNNKKNGNRPEYMKWCGVSAGPEPILLVFFKAQLPESPRWRACTCRVEGDNERVEKKWNVHTGLFTLRSYVTGSRLSRERKMELCFCLSTNTKKEN